MAGWAGLAIGYAPTFPARPIFSFSFLPCLRGSRAEKLGRASQARPGQAGNWAAASRGTPARPEPRPVIGRVGVAAGSGRVSRGRASRRVGSG